MKWSIILFILTLFLSCNQPAKTQTSEVQNSPKKSVRSSFQKILDKANVTGSILFFEPESNTYYSNNFERANTAYLPASTYKIANTIIALELGNVTNDSSILPWDGIQRNVENWNKYLTLKEAFSYSCVPCYQALARKAGVKNMRNILDTIEYPGMLFDSSTLDNFWLEGPSQISQMEQIKFLIKLKNEELNLKKSTYKTMRSIMLNHSNSNYKIYGKTGLAMRDTVTYGWYVGYAEGEKNTYYFATNIVPYKGMDLWNHFTPKRIGVTMDAFVDLIDNKK